MRGVFVVGTDTGVGKTVLSALLMAGAPDQVVYWKPVQTGTDEDDDTAAVRTLAGLPDRRVVDEGARHRLPASPHHAAAEEGEEITLEPLADIARRHDRPGRAWVVEGAGGLMVPLSPTLLLPDLVRTLGLPVVVAARTRLGTINHTLLTVRQCRREGLDVLGIVLLGEPDAAGRSGIADHAGVPILADVPRMTPLEPAAVRRHASALHDAPAIRRALHG
ncbi:MAG: dethiobiotin synthase [Myxococcota bacterium]